ncbi:site-specific integrase [Alphaproteobacteria bacterium]|nr:site-specific integrase [Alphaproteobacteria bacterium]
MAISKMKNGRWRVSVYQPNDAPRIRKIFKTREEARKFETITKGELAQGKSFYTKNEDPGNELFSNFLAKWHNGKESSVSEGTFKRLWYDLKNYIIPTLGSIKLCDINYNHAVHLRKKMLAKGLATQTIKNCEITLKQSLRFATRQRKIPFHPLEGFDLIKVNDAKKIDALSDSDQEKLIEVSKEYSDRVNDQRRFIFFYTLLYTGMRYGELIGLKWMDINLDEKLLRIERQCIFIESDSIPKLSTLKTVGSEREIDLTDEDIKTFKKYRAWLSEFILPKSNTPFIPKLDGNHLNKSFGRSTMTILTREAGLPYYAPHGLRHTHATNLANTEIPIKVLSHRLGHASVKTTMDRYAKVKTKASVKYLKEIQK